MSKTIFKQLLAIVFRTDKRLQSHTFNLVDGVFKHTNLCPRCNVIRILNEED